MFFVPIILMLVIFVGLRFSTARAGLKVVISDLTDMLIYKRNYTYGQKIETFWRHDYRYSEIVKKLVEKNDTVNFNPENISDVLHPIIVANFVYPIHIVATTSGSISYDALYPGFQSNLGDKCSTVFIFNIEELNYTKLDCSKYFMHLSDYKDSLGLIKR